MTHLSLPFAVTLAGLSSFGTFLYLTAIRSLPQGTPDLVCWEMPQADLRGWRRLAEWDRARVADKVRRGRALWREETSLKCRQYRDGDIGEFLVKEQWWKAK